MSKAGYALLIVDDNRFTRESLCENIDWKSCGIDQVFRASNGEEGFDFVRSRQIDIVITDIMMPVMDGVTLMEKIKKVNNSIIIIVISAYDDFEFARNAMKFDAYEYILKPIDYDNLLKSVTNAISEIETERTLREKIKSGQELLAERFYRRLTQSGVKAGNFNDDIEYLGISFQKKHYFCAIFDIDDKEGYKTGNSIEDIELLHLVLKNIISRVFKEHEFHVFSGSDDQIAAIIGCNDIIQTSKLYYYMGVVQEDIKKRFNVSISIGIGNEREGISDISSSFKEAAHALDHRFLMGFGKILFYRDFEPKSNDQRLDMYTDEDELVKYLKLGSPEGFDGFMSSFLSGFKKKQMSKENLYTAVIGIGVRIYQTIVSQDIESQFFTSDFVYRMYDMLQKFQTEEQIHEWIREVIIKAFDEICRSRENNSSLIINKIINFIDKNYGLEELNLDLIAKEISFSHSYISILFKKETGVNLFDYIYKIRIERSMEMLTNTNMLVSEVGEAVGYPNPSYFSNVFKKYTKMSPKEYRDRQQTQMTVKRKTDQ